MVWWLTYNKNTGEVMSTHQADKENMTAERQEELLRNQFEGKWTEYAMAVSEGYNAQDVHAVMETEKVKVQLDDGNEFEYEKKKVNLDKIK